MIIIIKTLGMASKIALVRIRGRSIHQSENDKIITLYCTCLYDLAKNVKIYLCFI